MLCSKHYATVIILRQLFVSLFLSLSLFLSPTFFCFVKFEPFFAACLFFIWCKHCFSFFTFIYLRKLIKQTRFLAFTHIFFGFVLIFEFQNLFQRECFMFESKWETCISPRMRENQKKTTKKREKKEKEKQRDLNELMVRKIEDEVKII